LVKFKDYLDKNFHKNTVKARLSYAKKYYNVLVNEEAKELLNLSFDKRIHVMKALATLSKFLGCYDKWKKIVEKYQLKWSNNDFGDEGSKGLDAFHKIFNKNNFSEMISQLKDTCLKLDNKKYSNVLIFCTLTGLRPAEACTSLQLLRERNNHDGYLNKENMIIEHFRIPSTFLRRTRKCLHIFSV
jgi:hypothetical protein